jgi:hypothetical protein
VSLPDWRQVAEQRKDSVRRFAETWDRVEREYREHARNLLLQHMDTEDAILAAPLLFGYTQEQGGRKAGKHRTAATEAVVLEYIANMKRPPAPHNLVAALVARGMRPDTARAALKRLARADKLPDVYAQHFRT